VSKAPLPTITAHPQVPTPPRLLWEGMAWLHGTPFHLMLPGCSPKPSDGGSVSGFSAPTPSPALRCRRTAPPPPPPHPQHSTASLHHPPPPSHTVHPKSSHRARFRWFLVLSPSPASRLRTHSPTTSSTPPHDLPPSPSMAILHGAPETEPSRSVSWFFTLSPLSRLAFTNAQPHHYHHLIHTIPPPPHITLRRHFYRRN
jgi:hypothetical protein